MNRIAIVGTAALVLLSGVAKAAPFQSLQSAAETSVPGNSIAQTPESVPHLVQFNGLLKDASLRPIAGVASVTFAIYAEQDGGTALWSETQNVLADASGRYNVLLGAATASGVPAELFGTWQSRWLGVTIARQPEMARVLLASVPYALKAGDADTLGGLPASAYVTTEALAASKGRAVSAGSTTIVATPQAATQTGAPEPGQSSVTQATPTGSGTTDYIPLWTSSSALGNSKLFQSTGGNIGVGTTTPAVFLDVNGDSIFRGSFQLVPQGTATASTGQLSHSYQWEASTYNSSTKAPVTTAFGFRATPQGNNTANPTSSLDLYYGPGGGTLTDTGLSINNKGVVTFVPGQTFPGASATVNEVSLPNTTSSTSGVITLGGQAFLGNAGGASNTFVGGGAGGSSEASGASNNNTGVGNAALAANTNGTNNTAAGSSALGSATTGNYNTAFGVQALEFEASGGSNTAIGYAAGMTDETGAFNTLIGANADVGKTNLTHATAIGAGAIVSESNAIVLGGINPDAVNVGIGTSAPGYSLEVDDHGTAGAAIFASTDFANHNAIIGSSAGSGSNGGYFVTSDSVGSGVVGVNTGGGKAGYFGGNVEVAGNLQVDDNETVVGTLTVTGNLIKPAGSFKIDDPIAPGEKYLSHSFVESPDMMNIYNGIAVLDAKGAAWVTMPEWFDALNQDFRYQLTSIGRPGPSLYIAREVKNNRFKIAGGRPGLRVSWQVTGIRHDAWANAHRIPTEEEKPADEQGHYLHPELFGASPDRSINATRTVPPAATGAAGKPNHIALQGHQ